jgi:hypothetical protein
MCNTVLHKVAAAADVWVRLPAEKQLEKPLAFVNLVFIHGENVVCFLVGICTRLSASVV